MPANDGSNSVWFATADIKGGKFKAQFHQLNEETKKQGEKIHL